MKSLIVSFELWSLAVDPFLLGAVLCCIILGFALLAVRRRRSAQAPQGAVEPVVAPVGQLEAGEPESRGPGESLVESESVGRAETPSEIVAPSEAARAPAEVTTTSSISLGMKQTRSSFLGRLKSLFSLRSRIDTSSLDELEELLIASDVGPRCAQELVDSVRGAVQSHRDVTQDVLTELLKSGVRGHLVDIPASHRIYSGDGAPLIVLVVGVNGAGKTTTVAKLAARYKAAGKRVLVVAADTFRAAAVHQLEEWSKRIGFEVVKGAENAKPAAVVFDGMVAAKSGSFDVVLVDTAGRLHTKTNLMQELEGVKNSITRHIPDGPHETILVVDGVSGQNALMQARQFNEAVALTGVVVTKLDGTPKGGIIVPISQELKVPIVYVGVGEKASDLLPFSADEFIAGMFDQTDDAPVMTNGSAVGGIRL